MNAEESAIDGPELSRRGFIQLGSAAGLSLVFAACGPKASSSTSSTGSVGAGSLKLPAYAVFQGPKPDLPATPEGVWPGYLSMPRDLVRSVPQPPGKGGEVTFMGATFNPAPRPVEDNVAWQAVNKDLNVDLKVPIILNTDYQAKLNAVIASGNLPDIFSLGSGIPQMADFLAASCADLTPFLSGDAIKEYPNLASIPTQAWRYTAFNGRILGVPIWSGNLGSVLFTNQNVLDELGITTINTTDDFVRMARAVTRPGARWATGSMTATLHTHTPLPFFLQVFGTPNDWRESGGKLTKDLETEEYKAAVAFLRSLWDAGVGHPDQPSLTGVQSAQNYWSGKTVTFFANMSGVFNYWDPARKLDPSFKQGIIPPFSPDGKRRGMQFLIDGGNVGQAPGRLALKQGSTDRVKEVLGVANYLAAPFGTQEFLLRNWGVKDTDYTLNDRGDPVQTERGFSELTVPWNIGVNNLPPTGMPFAVYNPIYPDHTTAAYEQIKQIVPLGVASPVAGLYSPTLIDKGAILNQQVLDGVKAILFGQASLSSLDQIIDTWRRNGGDTIRGEFERALQDSTR